MTMRRLALVALFAAAPAAAQSTHLLEVDLKSGEKTRIDAEELESDAAFDAALGDALGSGSTFSTKVLDQVVAKIVEGLHTLRPRSPATLLVFLSPGRVNLERLRRMPEVDVDLELVIDPCDRSVCQDSVATHIEMVGGAVGSPEHDAGRYKLDFRSLAIRAATQFHDKEMELYEVPMEDCVAAAAARGGGRAWLEESQHQEDKYEPLVARAVARRAAHRRVELDETPAVTRKDGQVQVLLRVHGDRDRTEQIVMDALAAAVEGMRQNRATPAMQEIEVELQLPGWKPRRFRAAGPSVAQWVDGKLDAKALWTTYVREIKKRAGAAEVDFSDDES
jgi:hypothetical protein